MLWHEAPSGRQSPFSSAIPIIFPCPSPYMGNYVTHWYVVLQCKKITWKHCIKAAHDMWHTPKASQNQSEALVVLITPFTNPNSMDMRLILYSNMQIATSSWYLQHILHKSDSMQNQDDVFAIFLYMQQGHNTIRVSYIMSSYSMQSMVVFMCCQLVCDNLLWLLQINGLSIKF